MVEIPSHAAGKPVRRVDPNLVADRHKGEAAGDTELPLGRVPVIEEARIYNAWRERRVAGLESPCGTAARPRQRSWPCPRRSGCRRISASHPASQRLVVLDLAFADVAVHRLGDLPVIQERVDREVDGPLDTARGRCRRHPQRAPSYGRCRCLVISRTTGVRLPLDTYRGALGNVELGGPRRKRLLNNAGCKTEKGRIRKRKLGVGVRNPPGCTRHPKLNLQTGESRSM